MKTSRYIIIFSVFLVILFTSESFREEIAKWNLGSPISKVLYSLGEEPPNHYFEPTEEQIKQGKEFIFEGRAINKRGKKTRYISKYYMCTSCHNTKREDPDLRHHNPDTRLTYVKEKGLPFLQGTTFFGIVNRESWYNGDYVKKYGHEVEAANKDLREAIQLCAVGCSQGREMKPWELDAVLAYFWSLQLKLSDLGITDTELAELNVRSADVKNHENLITQIKSYYEQTSPATFADSPPNKKKGFENISGNAGNGKDLYELSCLHCHKKNGVSKYLLDNSKASFKELKRNISRNKHFSLYQIIAYGTYAIPGHRPYMPNYPLEKMSQQQVEDLRAYIEARTSN